MSPDAILIDEVETSKPTQGGRASAVGASGDELDKDDSGAVAADRARARGPGTILPVVPSMTRLGVHVSLAPDREPEAYGAILLRVHDASGREVRSEARGRELEVLDIVLFVELDDGDRAQTRPGETRLIARVDWSAGQLRERVRRMVYDGGDRTPRWFELMAALESRGLGADDYALAALPLVLEFDDEVAARYGI